jgi:exodeoxyribonuclease-3
VDIVTWNVNSLKARKEFVELYLDECSPDILGIQELKLESDKVPREIFESRGYHLAIHGQKQWNGVLIASKTPIESIHTGLPHGDEGQSRLIAVRTGGLDIVNLYCPQGQSADSPKFQYKLGFFRALRAWISESYTPADDLIVMGDINIAPGPEDVYDLKAIENEPTYHPLEHAEWAKLEDWGLTDAVKPFLEPHSYSYWDYRHMAFRYDKGFRIDHHLVTASVMERVTHGWIGRAHRKKKDGLTASDHAPVGITLS